MGGHGPVEIQLRLELSSEALFPHFLCATQRTSTVDSSAFPQKFLLRRRGLMSALPDPELDLLGATE